MGGAGPADYSGAPSKKTTNTNWNNITRSEEHTSELQSPCNLVCRLLLEKKKKDETLVLEHEQPVQQFCRQLHAESPLPEIRDECTYSHKTGIQDVCCGLLSSCATPCRRC